MSTITKPTEEFDNKVITKFLELHPEWNDPKTFVTTVSSSISPALVKSVTNAMASGKFSGKYGRIGDIGQVLLFKITVSMKDLPTSASNHIAYEEPVRVSNFQAIVSVQDVQSWLKDITKIVSNDRIERAHSNSKPNLTFRNLLNAKEIREERIPLQISMADSKISNAADKRFSRMWAKDSSDSLYLKYRGSYIPALKGRRANGGVALIDDPSFWGKFWEDNSGLFEIIEEKTIDLIWNAYTSGEDPFKAVRPIIPAILYNFLTIIATISSSEDNEGNVTQNIEGFSLKIRPNGNSNDALEPLNPHNWQKAIGKAVCEINPEELQTIRTLSNKMDEPAIFNIPIDRFEPPKDSDIPALPPSWEKFFESKLGQNHSSQLYRIAKWVVSCLDQWNVNRTVLIIAGHGNDGKSMFTDVMIKGFNSLAGKDNFAKTLPAVSVEAGKTQVGLQKCMDSRVLVSPDVSKITTWLNSEVIKQITGGDEVTADVKFQLPVTRKMTGVKLLATTNFPVYLSDDHSISRTYPVVFKRSDNSPDWNVYTMKNKMLEEFEDWVKWCFAFAHAQDDSISVSYSNPAPIFSDSVPADVPFGSKQHWDAIGTEDGSEPMFRYRAFDEQSETDEEAFTYLLENCTCRSTSEKTFNMELRAELSRLAKDMNQAGLGKLIETASGWKAVTRAIKTLYPEAQPGISHGKRFWTGFAVSTKKDSPTETRRQRTLRSSSTLPAGL